MGTHTLTAFDYNVALSTLATNFQRAFLPHAGDLLDCRFLACSTAHGANYLLERASTPGKRVIYAQMDQECDEARLGYRLRPYVVVRVDNPDRAEVLVVISLLAGINAWLLSEAELRGLSPPRNLIYQRE